MGTPTISVTLSQLTCLYQFALVMGSSVIWGFLGSYFLLRIGSDVFAMLDGGGDVGDAMVVRRCVRYEGERGENWREAKCYKRSFE